MTDTNPKIGTAEVRMDWWDDDRQYDVKLDIDIYADGQWVTDRVYLFRGGAIETGRDLKARAQRFVEKQIARREVTPDNAPVVIDPKRLKALEECADLLRTVTPAGEDWWCPTCRDALDGSRVTFEERCDTCGTALTEVNTKPWGQAARAALSRLEALK